jgi:hypothetical protein
MKHNATTDELFQLILSLTNPGGSFDHKTAGDKVAPRRSESIEETCGRLLYKQSPRPIDATDSAKVHTTTHPMVFGVLRNKSNRHHRAPDR